MPNQDNSGFSNVSPNELSAEYSAALEDWNEERAVQHAAQEGIELTEEHWAVVYCLREYYRLNGPPEHGRELDDMLDKRFDEQGGRKYLRRLFPEGPVAQGARIAGLPVPAHTEDAGFGTSL